MFDEVLHPIASQRRPLATSVLQTYTHTLKEHILKRTRSFAVDGAVKERRALEYAVRTTFPDVVLIVRDAAHALRIAIKYPSIMTTYLATCGIIYSTSAMLWYQM